MKNDLMVATITSMEVADMVEKKHDVLLRDIRRYSKQISETNENDNERGLNKIDESDFWNESTYQNSQNKTMPCYNVTKMGCEFIAHKMTGTKGTIFTALYVKRFHDMEDKLKSETLSLTKLKYDPKKWIEHNRKMIEEICSLTDFDYDYVEKRIIDMTFSHYDYGDAVKNFVSENFRYPVDTWELLAYFNDTKEYIDIFIDYLLWIFKYNEDFVYLYDKNFLKNGNAILTEKGFKKMQVYFGEAVHNDDWYKRNVGKMEDIAQLQGKSLKDVCSIVLKRIWSEFDIKANTTAYENETFNKPKYPFDVVGYFPEISDYATKYIDFLLENSK